MLVSVALLLGILAIPRVATLWPRLRFRIRRSHPRGGWQRDRFRRRRLPAPRRPHLLAIPRRLLEALQRSSCLRIAGLPPVLTPSADSRIEIEVWLPADWNGKFQAVGNGGWAGVIGYAAMARALKEGYCDRLHGYGPQGRQRTPRDRSSGEARRLRVSRRARDGRAVEGDHRGALRPRRPMSYWNGCSTGDGRA